MSQKATVNGVTGEWSDTVRVTLPAQVEYEIKKGDKVVVLCDQLEEGQEWSPPAGTGAVRVVRG